MGTGFFKGRWLVPWGRRVNGACPKMLQFENGNLIENCYTRNTSNATTILARKRLLAITCTMRYWSKVFAFISAIIFIIIFKIFFFSKRGVATQLQQGDLTSLQQISPMFFLKKITIQTKQSHFLMMSKYNSKRYVNEMCLVNISSSTLVTPC